MTSHDHPPPWEPFWDLSAYGLPDRYDVEIPGRFVRAHADGCRSCWRKYQDRIADSPDGIWTLFLVVSMFSGLKEVAGDALMPEVMSLIEPPELSAALVAVGAGVRSREEIASWLAALDRDIRMALLDGMSTYLVGMASIRDAEAVTIKLV